MCISSCCIIYLESPLCLFRVITVIWAFAGCLGALEWTLSEAGHVWYGRRYFCMDSIWGKMVCGVSERQRSPGTYMCLLLPKYWQNYIWIAVILYCSPTKAKFRNLLRAKYSKQTSGWHNNKVHTDTREKDKWILHVDDLNMCTEFSCIIIFSPGEWLYLVPWWHSGPHCV